VHACELIVVLFRVNIQISVEGGTFAGSFVMRSYWDNLGVAKQNGGPCRTAHACPFDRDMRDAVTTLSDKHVWHYHLSRVLLTNLTHNLASALRGIDTCDK
jgi:hypothetical protein